MSVARYTTGTCQINGAGAVHGSGTLWASAVTPGDWFALTVAGPFYEVVTVTDDDDIIIEPAPSTTGAGQSYLIAQISPLRGSISQNNILLTAFRTQLGSILTVSGADKTFTLDKTATTDNAGLILKQGGTSLFQAGLFGNGSANTRYQIQYLVTATWTPAISVDPTTGKVGFGVAAATQILDAVATSAALALWDNSAAGTGKGGALLLQASNASSARIIFASLGAYVTTTTAAAEVGDLTINTMRAGTLTEAARFLGAGNLLMNINGTAALPAISRAGDPDTGIYWIAANNMGVAVNGAKVIDIAAAIITLTPAVVATVSLSTALYTGTTSTSIYANTTHSFVNAANNVQFALLDATKLSTPLYTAPTATTIYANTTHSFVNIANSVQFAILDATKLAISPTTASTSATTGALTCAGGGGFVGDIFGGASMSSIGAHAALTATAIPAGGTAGSGFKFSSTANYGVFFGSGAPTLSAAKGSLYLRSDGSGTGDRAYVNTNGTTTWTALTTVA